MHGMRKVVHVPRRDSRHRDTAVLGQVDAEILGELRYLLLRHAREAEHADLVRDVLPVTGGSFPGQAVPELRAHANDPIRHALDVLEPLLAKLLVGQDEVRDASPVERRVRVRRPHDDLDLGQAAVGLLLGTADEREGARPFSVQAHVLGEGLSHRETVAFFGEEPDRRGVAVNVARGESLVRHVQEREQPPALDDLRDFLPLLEFGVDARGVVGACVQQDDGAFGDFGDVLQSAAEVEAARLGVVVAVLFDR